MSDVDDAVEILRVCHQEYLEHYNYLGFCSGGENQDTMNMTVALGAAGRRAWRRYLAALGKVGQQPDPDLRGSLCSVFLM